ncbi:ABC transporter ATP-binding protein [Labrys okinawensis]|uniref:ABC transporter ATP-binding protein n=1 Tax=Labrys okinawensis TaxID=346911 RepID=UPI0039BCEAA8
MLTGVEPFVEFSNIQKTYDGESLVVKNLNLQVSKGEFLTMLGPSGSGKTTSLMMLAGFEAPTHGRITLDRQPIDKLPPHKRNIGMVFQNYALFPHMTIEENLAFPLKVRKMGRADIEGRVRRGLERVRLEGLGKRKPGQLSGGQQQRVALARALVFDPKLVLMDEPLGALDKQLREQMQFEIKHLHAQLGVTVIYVTHDQEEALTMSDRIAVFNQGVIQQLASPTELYEKPQNSFVAQFIGENNQLKGNVVELAGAACKVSTPCGKLIHARAVNVEGVGKPTTLSVRPERIALNPKPGSLHNIIEARVEELVYLGDHRRIRVRVYDNNEFVLKLLNVDQSVPLSSGMTVNIGWNEEDCLALDVA